MNPVPQDRSSAPVFSPARRPGIEVDPPDHLVQRAYEDRDCGALVMRRDGIIARANPVLCEWLGMTPEALQGSSLPELLTPESRLTYDTHLKGMLEQHGFARELIFDVARPDGSLCSVLVNARRFVDEAGDDSCISLTAFNATQTRRYESDLAHAKREAEETSSALSEALEALAREHERLRVALYSIADAVITTDARGFVQTANAAAEKLTGWSEAQMRGHRMRDIGSLFSAEGRQPRTPVSDCLASQTVRFFGDSVFVRSDGQEVLVQDNIAPILDVAGRIGGAVWVARDMRERRALDDRLIYEVTHDQLTGLLNRTEFERRMNTRWADASSLEREAVFCHIALDQFKVINDSAGHRTGDVLLQKVTEVLRDTARHADTMGRLGGDEFGVLLDGCRIDDGLRIAEKMCKAISEIRVEAEDATHTLTASIGLAVPKPGAAIASALLAEAEVACSIAKESGRNRACYFDDSEAYRNRRGEMSAIGRIKHALENDRFRLFCQPIVSTDPGHAPVRRGEILIRMLDENGTVLSPASFIPAAERFHQMQALDRWVMRKSLAWMAGQPEVHCAINVSGQSLGDASFLDYVLEQFSECEVAPERVCFEVTETAAISSLDRALEFMHALRARGVCFSLDDFGAGLASFAYLRTLPVDYVKIDGSFVKEMRSCRQSRAIVEAIQHVAQVGGLKTVAEWVEDAGILEELRVIGVNYAQGYGIGAPRPIEHWC